MVGRRGRPLVPVREPEWSEVCGLFHMRLKEAAAALNVSYIRLRRICRKNGLAEWPRKKIRYTYNIERRAAALGIQVRAGSPPTAGLAGSDDQQAKIVETKVEDEMVGIQEPVTGHPPHELITLNLIDKVGSSSDDN